MTIKFLKFFAVIITIPILEFLLLYPLSGAGTQFRYVSILPTALLMALIVAYRGRERFLPLCLQKKIFVINITLFTLYFLLLLLSKAFLPEPFSGPMSLLSALVTLWVPLIALSGFFAFIEPKKFFHQFLDDRTLIFLILILTCSRPVYYFLNERSWFFLADITTRAVYWVLQTLGYQMIRVADPLTVKSVIFEERIYAPCSGLEGISFFVAAFSFVAVLDWKAYSKKVIAAGYFTGIGYMFLLNILRISLFFMAGIWATGKWGPEKADMLVRGLFHGSIGWILYTLGIAIFFTVFFKLTHPSASSPMTEKTQ